MSTYYLVSLWKSLITKDFFRILGNNHSFSHPYYQFFLSYICTYIYVQGRPSSQCHRAMALVVFLPCPESQGIFWATHNKKPWFPEVAFPEVALVDFGADGWAPLYMYKGIGIYYFSSFCGLWGCGHKLRCWNKTCTLAIETLKMIGMINFFFFFIKRISFFKLLLAISHKQKNS